MNRLFNYLENHGILLCNLNPYVPSLNDIGCGWKEVTELIDQRLMFYSKSFNGRTTYLSRKAYLLLDIVKVKKPLTIQAEYIYQLLEGNPPEDTRFLKAASAPMLSKKNYQKAFNFLLEERYITAIQNGKQLNKNWSCFLYGTAKQWENLSKGVSDMRKMIKKENAIEDLWKLVGKDMSEKSFYNFAGICVK